MQDSIMSSRETNFYIDMNKGLTYRSQNHIVDKVKLKCVEHQNVDLELKFFIKKFDLNRFYLEVRSYIRSFELEKHRNSKPVLLLLLILA